MTITKIAADGKYLAQCRKCGTWVEVCPEYPENCTPEIFFEVLQASFYCCGLQQSATFTIEKDTVDFH
ncbi:MAG: hypothetical protein NTY36_00385 [Deltaproteobacteria bacterium]|nr:hypothetical protein [Deltaproteobacteria bacterium]